jgi:hypothetical protein
MIVALSALTVLHLYSSISFVSRHVWRRGCLLPSFKLSFKLISLIVGFGLVAV